MNTPARIMAIVVAMAVLSLCNNAQAGSIIHYSATQSYSSYSDSPFASYSGNLVLEDFEDGLLNVTGVRAKRGSVKGSGFNTDSVDADDGSMDGLGRQGHSFKSGNRKALNFRFTKLDGHRPTMAGLVWTDGKRNSWVRFRAWNAAGDLIGKIRVRLGDMARNGGTSDDRFLGITSNQGIARIQIVSNFANFEVDHLQFAYGFAVVPVPPALAIGAVGLAGVALVRRRWLRS